MAYERSLSRKGDLMSFSFQAKGNKEEALRTLEAQSGYGDTQHFDVCRDALKSAIEKVPPDTIVEVSANGHHNYDPANPSGSFQLSFSVKKG
jgi:hypothetical protein